MAWYRGGTVAVTNGSATVTGTNTDFVANVGVGHAFQGPDGRSYEVAAIVSATQLTLASTYQGATASGQAYSVQPTTSYAIDLAIQAAALVNAFGAIRDGIGQGLIASGTLAAPGLRFSADQDTGIYRSGENALALVTGGVARLIAGGDGIIAIPGALAVTGAATVGSIAATGALPISAGGAVRVHVTADGNVGIGTTNPQQKLVVSAGGAAGIELTPSAFSTAPGFLSYDRSAGAFRQIIYGALFHSFYNSGNEVARFDSAGSLLVGATSGSSHILAKPVSSNSGAPVASIVGASEPTAVFYGVAGGGLGNSAAAALKVSKDNGTGRGVSTPGTINASGADYAEYIRKADGCGTIAKGDACGIDRNGLLVKLWSTAVRFVVKSTDPNLVGGDSWSAHLGERPAAPVYEAPLYDGPAEPVKPIAPEPFVMPEITLPQQPTRNEGENDETFVLRMAAYLVEQSAALAAIAQAGEAEAASAAAQAEYGAAVRQYEVDLAAYDAARLAYDRVEAEAIAAHDQAMKVHAVTLAKWEADLEAARQTVDRIAFSGQVPVNVNADTLAACEAALADGVAVYLVAIARGAGIGVAAIREGDMTLAQYMRRVGCVWAIRDGRPWVDVQHG